jgi:hypothetical protein
VLNQTVENLSASETEAKKIHTYMLKLLLSRFACCFMWVKKLVLKVNDKYKIDGFGERR